MDLIWWSLRVIREKQIFNFHLKNPNLVNNTLLRAGRTQSKRKLQNSAWYPFYGWTLFKEKSNTLSSEYSPPVYWMPCRVLEFPWISEVSSNPQLTLASFTIRLLMKKIFNKTNLWCCKISCVKEKYLVHFHFHFHFWLWL